MNMNNEYDNDNDLPKSIKNIIKLTWYATTQFFCYNKKVQKMCLHIMSIIIIVDCKVTLPQVSILEAYSYVIMRTPFKP
jgi:hypothetical protein